MIILDPKIFIHVLSILVMDECGGFKDNAICQPISLAVQPDLYKP